MQDTVLFITVEGSENTYISQFGIKLLDTPVAVSPVGKVTFTMSPDVILKYNVNNKEQQN